VPRTSRQVRVKMLPSVETAIARSTEPSMSTATLACSEVSVKRRPL
jgi:hypothetical protein